MSDTESFESVARSYDCYVGFSRIAVKEVVNRLKRAHDREIRDVSQREFARGMDAGKHSMDAEHRAVAMRLRALPLDGGSHENLSQIARAVYHSDFGWTQGACASLRDELVRLMGGVSDDTCDSQCCGACAAGDGGDSGEQTEVSDGRVADDCGADTGCGDGGGDLHMAGVTDELRKWASIEVPYKYGRQLHAIADRIDEQFGRICEQQEAVLQKTIDEMVKEYEHDRESDQLRIEKLERQRDHWHQQTTDMMNHADAMEHERDAAYARTDELSDELLRTRRERDEARNECDRLKRDMLDKWVPRTSYEEKVEKYRRAYMESDAWRKSLQEKLNAMRDAITAALNG